MQDSEALAGKSSDFTSAGRLGPGAAGSTIRGTGQSRDSAPPAVASSPVKTPTGITSPGAGASAEQGFGAKAANSGRAREGAGLEAEAAGRAAYGGHSAHGGHAGQAPQAFHVPQAAQSSMHSIPSAASLSSTQVRENPNAGFRKLHAGSTLPALHRNRVEAPLFSHAPDVASASYLHHASFGQQGPPNPRITELPVPEPGTHELCSAARSLVDLCLDVRTGATKKAKAFLLAIAQQLQYLAQTDTLGVSEDKLQYTGTGKTDDARRGLQLQPFQQRFQPPFQDPGADNRTPGMGGDALDGDTLTQLSQPRPGLPTARQKGREFAVARKAVLMILGIVKSFYDHSPPYITYFADQILGYISSLGAEQGRSLYGTETPLSFSGGESSESDADADTDAYREMEAASNPFSQSLSRSQSQSCSRSQISRGRKRGARDLEDSRECENSDDAAGRPGPVSGAILDSRDHSTLEALEEMAPQSPGISNLFNEYGATGVVGMAGAQPGRDTLHMARPGAAVTAASPAALRSPSDPALAGPQLSTSSSGLPQSDAPFTAAGKLAIPQTYAGSPPLGTAVLQESPESRGIVQRVGSFVVSLLNDRIIKASNMIYVELASSIRSSDTVLVYGASHLVWKALQMAAIRCLRESGECFELIVVDAPEYLVGGDMAARAAGLGISTTYCMLGSVSRLLSRVTKAVVGAFAVSATGHVLGRVGTSLLAEMCSQNQIPFVVAAERFKYTEAQLLDSTLSNTLGAVQQTAGMETTLRVIGEARKIAGVQTPACIFPLYDITPPNRISVLISEYGSFSPANARAMLDREA